MDGEFILWYHFDGRSIISISHNKNRLIAALSENNFILVWQQDKSVLGPRLRQGRVISLIDMATENIERIQWVEDSDYLLIITSEKILVWDVYRNELHRDYEAGNEIHFGKMIGNSIMLVFDGGSFILLTEHHTHIISNQSNLVQPTPTGILAIPELYHIGEDIAKEEIEEYKAGWRERRRFEGRSSVEISEELYIYPSDWDIPDVNLPRAFSHLFDGAENVMIQKVDELVVIQSPENCIVTLPMEEEWQAVQVPEIIIHLFKVDADVVYYIVRSRQRDYRIDLSQERLVLETLPTELLENIELTNMPLFQYMDLSQDIIFARFNFAHGYIWYPDDFNDHLFIDLLTRQGSIFQDTGRERYLFAQVAEDSSYLLEWIRGEKYPSGTLIYRDILEPEKEPVVLYDVTETGGKLTDEEFSDLEGEGEDLSFPLIVPDWHIVNLRLYYTDYHKSYHMSNSQYYVLLEILSKKEAADQLSYPEPPDGQTSILLYGDLKLDIDSKTITFEGISPLWVRSSTDLLAFHHIDGRIYIVDVSSAVTIPVHDFPTPTPIEMTFIGDLYYVVVYPEIRQTNLVSHPAEPEDLEIGYPYMIIDILNLQSKERYRKSLRFPVRLRHRVFKSEYIEEKNWIVFYLPSYTDPFEEVLCVFDFTETKFHVTNSSEQNRYWIGYTHNSPYQYFKYGEEFHLVEHPEIKRDYVMRPFYIFDNALVRKRDNLLVSVADDLTKVPQQSTHKLYSLEGTKVLHLPFYHTHSFKPVYIEEEYAGLLTQKLISLERIDVIPRIHRFKPNPRTNDLALLRRLREFIEFVHENREVHTSFGIAYQHPEWSKYEDVLVALLKVIRRKLG